MAVGVTVVALIVYALPRRTRNAFTFVRRHRVLLGASSGDAGSRDESAAWVP